MTMTMTLTMNVPFVDLSRQHAVLAEELRAAFDRVIRRGSFTLGEEVEAFEREFAAYIGVADAVGVSSGTDALHLALRAMRIGPGDEVILPANTFAATAEAVVMAGARPVLVDVRPDTLLMDLDAAEAAITPNTRALIPVHLYGQCVDMAAVGRIARTHDLKVIEDACQAHGASCAGTRAGSAGDAGCFSFYPSKNLGAVGDGGMVTTNDPEIARRVRLLRNHGEDSNRLHVESGYCNRLHGLQAALLRTKLPKLDEWNRSRRQSADLYAEALAHANVSTPSVMPDATHVYHLYVARFGDRDAARKELGDRGIQTAVHYAVPLHLEPAFEDLGYRRGQFPVAERAASQIASLPMFPYMTEAEVLSVAAAVEEVAAHA